MQDLAVIRKLIESTESQYKAFAATAQQGFNYYGNQDNIKRTGAAAIDEINGYLMRKGANPLRSADNRVSLNRHRIVVDQKVGYLFTVPPSFDLPEDSVEQTLLEKVNDTIGTQWPKVIKQLGIDASNTGKAWLAYWVDANGKFDYWYINPLTVRPIYDRSTVKKRLKCLVRVYDYLDDSGNAVTRYEVWDDIEVAYLVRPAVAASVVNKPEIVFETLPQGGYNIQPHSYGRIPFIEFQNNAHAVGDLPMYKDIIDALDKLISGFCNDVDDLQEIIWVVKNYGGERANIEYDSEGNEIVKKIDLLQWLKAKKFLEVDENGSVETVRGEIPHEARSILCNILNDEFWPAAMAVNPNPEKVGNQSGEFMQHLFNLLELKAGLMETEFRDSIDAFLQAVLHYLGADESAQFTQTWKRTKPQNAESIAGIIASTPDTVMSDETKTKLHPLVDDWQAERRKIEAEQAEREKNTLDLLAQQEREHAKSLKPNTEGGDA